MNNIFLIIFNFNNMKILIWKILNLISKKHKKENILNKNLIYIFFILLILPLIFTLLFDFEYFPYYVWEWYWVEESFYKIFEYLYLSLWFWLLIFSSLFGDLVIFLILALLLKYFLIYKLLFFCIKNFNINTLKLLLIVFFVSFSWIIIWLFFIKLSEIVV